MNQETHSDGIDENPDGQLTLGRWITQCELNNTQDTRESAAFYAAAAWLDESVHERRRRSFGLFQSAVGHLAVILSTTLHYWRRIPFKICFGLNFVWRRNRRVTVTNLTTLEMMIVKTPNNNCDLFKWSSNGKSWFGKMTFYEHCRIFIRANGIHSKRPFFSLCWYYRLGVTNITTLGLVHRKLIHEKKGRKRLDGRKRQSDARDVVK